MNKKSELYESIIDKTTISQQKIAVCGPILWTKGVLKANWIDKIIWNSSNNHFKKQIQIEVKFCRQRLYERLNQLAMKKFIIFLVIALCLIVDVVYSNIRSKHQPQNKAFPLFGAVNIVFCFVFFVMAITYLLRNKNEVIKTIQKQINLTNIELAKKYTNITLRMNCQYLKYKKQTYNEHFVFIEVWQKFQRVQLQSK